MSKLLAIAASLKSILIVASVALARGDMLPVILLSVLFNLAQLGAKSVDPVAPPSSLAAGNPETKEDTMIRDRDTLQS
jgi:hypothetical protein